MISTIPNIGLKKCSRTHTFPLLEFGGKGFSTLFSMHNTGNILQYFEISLKALVLALKIILSWMSEIHQTLSE